MSNNRKPWEPDPRKVGNWTAMFEPQARDVPSAQPTAMATDAFDDAELADTDSTSYKPWLLQRGRSSPTMMLELRRFDGKSGLWRGWAISWPSLHAVEYIGTGSVTLDFGSRTFALEGRALDTLVRHLQYGNVATIQEYSEHCWPQRPNGPLISAIRDLAEGTPQR